MNYEEDIREKILKVIEKTKILELLKKELDCYLNDEQLENDLVEVISDNMGSSVNRCHECGVDMGEQNPRQYCGKGYCESNYELL